MNLTQTKDIAWNGLVWLLLLLFCMPMAAGYLFGQLRSWLGFAMITTCFFAFSYGIDVQSYHKLIAPITDAFPEYAHDVSLVKAAVWAKTIMFVIGIALKVRMEATAGRARIWKVTFPKHMIETLTVLFVVSLWSGVSGLRQAEPMNQLSIIISDLSQEGKEEELEKFKEVIRSFKKEHEQP